MTRHGDDLPSSAKFGGANVGWLGRGRPTCCSIATVDVDLAGSRNVEAYVRAAFTHRGKTIGRCEAAYFADIGPGGLGATRTTAAFANALGFAKTIPVIGIHAFELIGFHVAQSTQKAVVCIRPAARPNYYMALYDQGALSDFSFVDVDAVQSFVRRHQHTASFAGKFSFVEVVGSKRGGLACASR